MDFFEENKQKLVILIENYLEDNSRENELVIFAKNLIYEDDFKQKDLFRNLLDELIRFLPELSNKELKQRILIINSYSN